MTIVVDASLVVTALLNVGQSGRWAEQVLSSDSLAAPHHLPVEAAAVLRRRALAGEISQDAATWAHLELLDIPMTLFAYGPFAARVWQLRGAVTPYDAWYVALAEALDVPLATLDVRLTRANGPTCEFLVPPEIA